MGRPRAVGARAAGDQVIHPGAPRFDFARIPVGVKGADMPAPRIVNVVKVHLRMPGLDLPGARSLMLRPKAATGEVEQPGNHPRPWENTAGGPPRRSRSARGGVSRTGRRSPTARAAPGPAPAPTGPPANVPPVPGIPATNAGGAARPKILDESERPRSRTWPCAAPGPTSAKWALPRSEAFSARRARIRADQRGVVVRGAAAPRRSPAVHICCA